MTWKSALCCLLLFFVGTPAYAGEEAEDEDREEDIFGTEDADDDDDDDGIAAKLAAADDPLDIGGQLYLRLDYFNFEANAAKDLPIQSPSYLDVYFDARPSHRLRAFSNIRLRHDFTLREGDTNLFGQPVEPTEVQLDQLWAKFDIERRVFFTVGRQRIKWGSSRIWNPTDFLNRQRRNPLDLVDERLGLGLIKMHVPVESKSWNFYAIVDADGARTPQDLGLALRAEVLIHQTEISLSGAVRHDNPHRIGLDVSSALSIFDVRVEGAVVHLLSTPFFRGNFNPPTELGEQYSRRDQWIAQVTAGTDVEFRYNDEDSVILGAEYFFNDAGYDSAELYPILLLTGAAEPFYQGRHYVAFFALLAGPGNWDQTSFVLTGIGNLSDNSYVTRLDYSVRVLNYLSVSAYGMVHFGDPGEFKLSFDIPPIPGVPGLEQGATVPAPVADVGLRLSLSI